MSTTETQALTPELLTDAAFDATAFTDEGADAARLRRKLDRQLAALRVINELDIEGLRVERVRHRKLGKRYVSYVARVDGDTMYVVAIEAEGNTIRYGGAYGATAQTTAVVAGLMLLAAADADARV